MIIETKLLGEVEINESEIITFEQGLLGLPEYKNYILLSLDIDLPLALLQSTEVASIGFVIAFPYAFKKDFEFDLSEEDIQDLKIASVEDVITYAIVTLKESFKDSTINLLAPLVINTKTNTAKQIVLQDNSQYSLQFPLQLEIGSAI
ncbi:flagellar assembly protein FliW [Solibacillus daqui]|uniref:flagellar assembly protein FliW n=1 Tax=Solibacillus daqui TaxID=2912187 RepID=UPI00236674CF|nr:flagellar assembly protein FliW [Solibacillus daqui]